ncbi:hypothetical protein [Pseudomonas sp. Fl4BN1]|uniref:hypothetical protein n=1 Tax=Pseudomonas sp. Fl4BN1 TaxID=2697651 RepID=UPI0013783E38|nr:hypothetical protein [Pseudomonas sp. Fl4BN1]NBF11789.1 hypothetical protein [Pseudomonas sp. Fl4BN1]
MKLRLSTLLLGLGLCAPVQAAPTAETEATFQQAMRMAEDNQQRLELLIEQEQQGQMDREASIQAMQQIMPQVQIYEGKLRQASAAGHGVATYLLANLEEGRKTLSGHDYTAQHAQACALYQSATDQGLLAAAVMLMRECETAFQRFKFNDPELLRLRAQLLKALEQPDPYADHYPLPARNSFCFKQWAMPKIEPERPLATLKDLYTPALLSLEQFQADGYYLLAIKDDIENPPARGYFQQTRALAPDCLDPISLGVMFDAMDRQAR